MLNPGPACLTANTSSRIFPFEEKGLFKILIPIPFDAQDQVDRQCEELIANVPASGLL